MVQVEWLPRLWIMKPIYSRSLSRKKTQLNLHIFFSFITFLHTDKINFKVVIAALQKAAECPPNNWLIYVSDIPIYFWMKLLISFHPPESSQPLLFTHVQLICMRIKQPLPSRGLPQTKLEYTFLGKCFISWQCLELFYIMFSIFLHSLLLVPLWIFHKYWRKKAITSIFWLNMCIKQRPAGKHCNVFLSLCFFLK